MKLCSIPKLLSIIIRIYISIFPPLTICLILWKEAAAQQQQQLRTYNLLLLEEGAFRSGMHERNVRTFPPKATCAANHPLSLPKMIPLVKQGFKCSGLAADRQTRRKSKLVSNGNANLVSYIYLSCMETPETEIMMTP